MPDPRSPRASRPIRWGMVVWLAPVYVALPLAVAMVMRVTLVEAYETDGPSMEPTLLHGDRFVVDKSAYGLALPFSADAITTWASPERGDIVVLRSPADGVDVVKRVIGVAGDTITIDEGRVIVEGRALVAESGAEGECPSEGVLRPDPECRTQTEAIGDRRWRTMSSASEGEHMGPFTVPEGHVFVLGDHRDRSNDSRNPRIGAVPISRVRGRARYVYYSAGEDGELRADRMLMEIR